MRQRFTSEQLSQARERITCTGQSIADWCREKGLDYQITGHVLMGRCKGSRGEAFRAAVELGLKPAPPKKPHKASPAQLTRVTA